MAEFIKNDFTRELNELFNRHKKTIEWDKTGFYIVDTDYHIEMIMSKPTSASEDYRDKIFFTYEKNK